MIIVYQWRVLEQDGRGRKRWRTLGWRMREDQAAGWAANHGKHIEKVSGSAEVRTPLTLQPSGGIMCAPGFEPLQAGATRS